MLKKDVTLALNYALTKGFQIHPDALKILEDIDSRQLQQIIKDIVREKTKQKMFLINQDDLESFLGIKEDENLQNEHKILFDPTPKITSAEGVDGFNALFASRFSKLKKIISIRPEANQLKSIASVIATKSDSDMYVCGLVSSRSSERNITKLVVDDQTGSIEAIVFDNELQKIANSLLIDQFVMLRIVVGKNGGFVAKDIITDRKSTRLNSSYSSVSRMPSSA